MPLLDTTTTTLSGNTPLNCTLLHVSDDEPGIKRIRCGKGFRYVRFDGHMISIEDKARIASLVIPPAWTEVWICCAANGHLQATGRDARGRKQYRYHPGWMAIQGDHKFSNLSAFARRLSRLRQSVEVDMRRRSLSREKVVATVIWLMDRLLLRVGNLNYARDNKSFGVTTLRNRHVKADGAFLRFVFTGKSGKKWNLSIADRRINRIIRSIQELPGQQLFQYIDDDGTRRPVTSEDINAYLRMAMEADFTSKHFRTWAASARALDALGQIVLPASEAAKKRILNQAIDEIARALGNTRAVCRSAYIHPDIVGHWLEGQLQQEVESASALRLVAPELNDAERRALKWLVYHEAADTEHK